MHVKLNVRLLASAGVIAGVLSIGTVAALATKPSDPPPKPTTPVIGRLHGPTKVTHDDIGLATRSDAKVATFEINYPIGAYSGWHSHPGIVIAVVKSGAVERQTGCEMKTFRAGDSFTEVGPHFVRNSYRNASAVGATPAVLEITQIYPADAPSRRIDQQAPVCPHGVTRD
jgi:quercetin dioxygenase-like cupin family protein